MRSRKHVLAVEANIQYAYAPCEKVVRFRARERREEGGRRGRRVGEKVWNVEGKRELADVVPLSFQCHVHRGT